MDNKISPVMKPKFGLQLPLDCDFVLLVPPNHNLAKKNNEKLSLTIQVEPFLDKESNGILMDPHALSDSIDKLNKPMVFNDKKQKDDRGSKREAEDGK